MSTTAQPRPLAVGERVTVTNYPRAVWRIVAIADGLADLTKINSFERLDYRGVALERLNRTRQVV